MVYGDTRLEVRVSTSSEMQRQDSHGGAFIRMPMCYHMSFTSQRRTRLLDLSKVDFLMVAGDSKLA